MTKSSKGPKSTSTAGRQPISRAASSAKSKGGKAATKAKPSAKTKTTSKVAASKAKKATPTKVKKVVNRSSKVAPKTAPKAAQKVAPAKSAPVKAATKAPVAKVAAKADEKLPVFLGLSPKYSSAASARVHVIPVPYEHTTSYKQGTALGPRAILEASQEVELFDDELWIEPFKIGVHTAEPVDMARVQSGESKPFQTLYETVKPLVDNDKFPLVIGGEHSPIVICARLTKVTRIRTLRSATVSTKVCRIRSSPRSASGMSAGRKRAGWRPKHRRSISSGRACRTNGISTKSSIHYRTTFISRSTWTV